MKVLHVVKTSEGARWAALQARELIRRGIEVHVALPSRSGTMVQFWKNVGCIVHFENCCLPLSQPWKLASRFERVSGLARDIRPDMIHSHHVTTTLMLRMALRGRHEIPRLFQVPGPVHLEHAVYRQAEIMSAEPNDYWIGSSRYITRLFRRAGVPDDRVFLSYYGHDLPAYSRTRTHRLRT